MKDAWKTKRVTVFPEQGVTVMNEALSMA